MDLCSVKPELKSNGVVSDIHSYIISYQGNDINAILNNIITTKKLLNIVVVCVIT